MGKVLVSYLDFFANFQVLEAIKIRLSRAGASVSQNLYHAYNLPFKI
jgi:hypothetical protein